jgi:Flp pilus assembly protein TadD
VQGRVAQSSLPLIKLEPHPIASGSDFVRSCQSNTLVFDQQKTDDIFASPSTGVSQIGDLQIEQKNFSAAVKALRSAVALEPENAEFHLALGCSLEKLGDYAAAENAYRQATKLESNNPVAYFGLGTTLAKQEKFRAALFAYSIALVLKPEEPRTYQAVGSIYEKLGKPADAAHFFQKANYLTVISQNHERL